VAADDDGGPGADSLIYRFPISVTNIYFISASGFSSSTGTYALNVFLENTGTAPLTAGSVTAEREPNNSAATANNVSTSWRPVEYLSRTSGTFTPGDTDVFRYQFTAGDLVTVNLDSTSGVDTSVALLNAAGATIASENGESFAAESDSPIYAFAIPTTGVYFLQARPSFGGFSEGSYVAEVFLSSTTPPPAGGAGSRADFFSVTLGAGETATLALKSLAAGAVQMELQNTAGRPLAVGAAEPELVGVIHNFTAADAGTYFVRISPGAGPAVPYSSSSRATPISIPGATIVCQTRARSAGQTPCWVSSLMPDRPRP